VFRDRLNERLGDLIDPMLKRTVNERIEALVVRTLEIMFLKLDEPDVKKIPDQLVLRALEISTRALGMGRPESEGPLVNVNVHLEDLGDRLTSLLRKKKQQELKLLEQTHEAQTIEG
jgi:hypothetical protein